MFDSGFNQALGVEVVEATSERVVLTTEIGPQHHQPYGIVHGGVWCALVETAASMGAGMTNRDGQVVGVSNHTDFIRPHREGRITTTATPIHQGRTQQLWLVENTNEDGKLVSRGEVRLQNLQPASM
jgi:1,4-dihydroxy-2-naphthoyl-CoA hydrolase